MNALPPIPRFVFAYAARAPRSTEDLVKAPEIKRQLILIDRYLADIGRVAGKLFWALPTYRERTFVDHPAFEQAVACAGSNHVPLLVGDLDDLWSRIPPDRFPAYADRLRALDIEIIDARTGKKLRDISVKKWAELHGMSVARKRSGLAISAGRQRGQKPVGNGGKQMAGAMANKRKAERRAEKIAPVVEEMEAALPAGKKLSASDLMRRLNELGIRGPNSAEWNRMSATRYLRTIREAETPPEG